MQPSTFTCRAGFTLWSKVLLKWNAVKYTLIFLDNSACLHGCNISQLLLRLVRKRPKQKLHSLNVQQKTWSLLFMWLVKTPEFTSFPLGLEPNLLAGEQTGIKFANNAAAPAGWILTILSLHLKSKLNFSVCQSLIERLLRRKWTFFYCFQSLNVEISQNCFGWNCGWCRKNDLK